jgi:hypothetical protein
MDLYQDFRDLRHGLDDNNGALALEHLPDLLLPGWCAFPMPNFCRFAPIHYHLRVTLLATTASKSQSFFFSSYNLNQQPLPVNVSRFPSASHLLTAQYTAARSFPSARNSGRTLSRDPSEPSLQGPIPAESPGFLPPSPTLIGRPQLPPSPPPARSFPRNFTSPHCDAR